MHHFITDAASRYQGTGTYHCLLCNFQLTKFLLHAPTGAVGISPTHHQQETDEKCPNDGSDLILWENG